MSAQDTAIDAVVKGWRGYRGGDLWGKAKAALDGLAAAGFAVVELPEPVEREDDEIADCWDEMPYQVLVWGEHPGEVQFSYNFEPAEPLSPDEACALGAALIAAGKLAAANKAEAVGDE